MRGAISLAIALTLPVTIHGEPFFERPTLIFLAAVVVVTTLIGEGLTLAPVLRWMGLVRGEEYSIREGKARVRVIEAGLARLDEMAKDGEVDETSADMYRQMLEFRMDRARRMAGDEDAEVQDTTEFRAEIARAQHGKLDQLYRDRKITDEMRRSIARSVDSQTGRRDH
jgi:CPA1 family monovalent cation:H+ antiporter